MDTALTSPVFAAFDAAASGTAILALITGTEGPAYRTAGAAMVFLPCGERIGSLSSGCIEDDLALHAEAAAIDGLPRQLRYGLGSPWIDLQLPCGGGIDVLVLPRPDSASLTRALAFTRGLNRRPALLQIAIGDGTMQTLPLDWSAVTPVACLRDDRFTMTLMPELRFEVYGAGVEAWVFVRLLLACGYDVRLHAPDRSLPALPGACIVPMTAPVFDSAGVDPRTAVVLFFHDHDWEPLILADALASPAFWVGAQGSRVAAATRRAALLAEGVPTAQIDRLRGPIGLIPSTRDPRTLAVSVMAEILAAA